MKKNFDFSKNPAFQAMTEEKQKMTLLLADSLYHKNITEALPQIMSWKKQMEEKNISFTAEENRILTEILMAEMSPSQRKQYEALKAFMK
ncbi:MAG: hypothetical protein IJ733_15210 [Lachnospiraceae bacterium]|nr:hypothetical protein [Lachnospiraceae bacterium]